MSIYSNRQHIRQRLYSLLLALCCIIQLCGSVFAAGVIELHEDGVRFEGAYQIELTGIGKQYGYRFSGKNAPGIAGSWYRLPIASMPNDTYDIVATGYQSDGSIIETRQYRYTLNNPYSSNLPGLQPTEPEDGTPGANTPALSRAVMIPYASVYSDPYCSHVICHLKYHDIVNIQFITNGVAKVDFDIQSSYGDTTELSSVDAIYQDPFSKHINGYMKTSSFKSESRTWNEKARDAVELAYSRLGVRGVYSQSKRFQDYYLDCSAMVSWCWYQVGLDMTLYGSTVTGLAKWADAHNAWIWQATPEYETAQREIQAYKDSLPDCWCAHGGDSCDCVANNCSCLSVDYPPAPPAPTPDPSATPGPDGVVPVPTAPPAPDPIYYCDCHTVPDTLVFGSGKYGDAITESCLVRYTDGMDTSVLARLQPGDIVFFNYCKNDLRCQYNDGGPQDMTHISSAFEHNFATYHIIEPRTTYGYDHVGMVVKVKDNSITIIETANPSINTVLKSYGTGAATANNIVAIMRPTNGI